MGCYRAIPRVSVTLQEDRNEFVVCTDNNLLTYIFSSANLDAAGQRWVARLASYNFSLEYQKGKDNTVADFLSQMNEHLPEDEVQEYLNQIPYPGVKAVLDNAITPIEERAEQGVRLTPDCQGVPQEEMIVARPTRLATTNVTDWKQEQKEDPVLYQVAKYLRAPREHLRWPAQGVGQKGYGCLCQGKGATTDQEQPLVLEDSAGTG